MADVFDTGSAPGCQFKIPAFPNPKPRPDPAPSPPDEGVDPFGVLEKDTVRRAGSARAPATCAFAKPERSRGLPWRTAPPRQTMARPQSNRATLSATLRARMWPVPGRMLKASSAGPQFVGDDAQLAEIEREQMVARKVALRKYLRGEQIPPESRRLVREALGISNDDAAHLGLSDFSTETCQGRRDMILGHVVEQRPLGSPTMRLRTWDLSNDLQRVP